MDSYIEFTGLILRGVNGKEGKETLNFADCDGSLRLVAPNDAADLGRSEAVKKHVVKEMAIVRHDGEEQSARGRGHSSGELAGWQPLREFQKGEDCVNIYENIVQWGDLPCAQKLPFICESKRPCRCKYGSREYPCDRPIGTLAHCCTHVHCDAQGYIRTWSLSDPLSGVKSNKCCPYGTELVQDGETAVCTLIVDEAGTAEYIASDLMIFDMAAFSLLN
eukprot:maker-scaffold1994_size23005-snap-gene-0.6 protein:Tk07618 transcript:maker-scaffold1994_size23005-snap-gene-0.6-mRNA-1 annotation:"lectin subunit alpha-like"